MNEDHAQPRKVDPSVVAGILAEYCQANRGAKKPKSNLYAKPESDVIWHIMSELGKRGHDISKGQARQTVREELGGAAYREYLSIWKKLGGLAARPPAEAPRPKRRPLVIPDLVIPESAEVVALRRQIATHKNEIKKLQRRVDDLLGKTKAPPAPVVPKLRVRLPRQNYKDDT